MARGNGSAYASDTPVPLSDPSGLYECRNGRSMNYDVHGNARGDGAWCPSANDPYCPGGSSEVGQAAQAVGEAEAQHSRAQQQVSSAAKVLVETVKDILGVNAAMDCDLFGGLKEGPKRSEAAKWCALVPLVPGGRMKRTPQRTSPPAAGAG
ncbi:hypothetical protein [Streptomyces sp. NPDC090798]|uniref:hypothetical protein n=1 Tax=Streptomyces sp. NPDC090798 TaxID=3365968 RepID=UPI00382DFA13